MTKTLDRILAANETVKRLYEIDASGLDRVGKSAAMLEVLKQKSGRQCGDCSLCCLLLDVPEAQKPKHGWCPHCRPGRGCGIYQTRPDPCRAYGCLWLADGSVPDYWRPKEAGLVLDYHNEPDCGGMVLRLHVHPKHPNRWREEPFRSEIRAAAKRGLIGTEPFAFRTVVIIGGEWKWIVLPHREVPYGPGVYVPLGPDHFEFIACPDNDKAKRLTQYMRRLQDAAISYRTMHPRAGFAEVFNFVVDQLGISPESAGQDAC